MKKSESKLLFWSDVKGIDEFVNQIAQKGNIENVNIIPTGSNNQHRIIVNVLYEPYDNERSKDLLIKSLDVIYNDKKISINHLQSKLEIGFNRASSIINSFETLGIISKKNDDNQRTILLEYNEALNKINMK
jgi:S-DNA-T family DNA segregation ATPase FtsK/SpoIIIE